MEVLFSTIVDLFRATTNFQRITLHRLSALAGRLALYPTINTAG